MTTWIEDAPLADQLSRISLAVFAAIVGGVVLGDVSRELAYGSATTYELLGEGGTLWVALPFAVGCVPRPNTAVSALASAVLGAFAVTVAVWVYYAPLTRTVPIAAIRWTAIGLIVGWAMGLCASLVRHHHPAIRRLGALGPAAFVALDYVYLARGWGRAPNINVLVVMAVVALVPVVVAMASR